MSATVTPHDDSEELRRRQRSKNLTLLAVLLGFAVIVYLVTIVKLKLL